MHERSMQDMLTSENFKQLFGKNPTEYGTQIADRNKEILKDGVPKNVRLPEGKDITKWKTWEMNYRTKNPKASDREVRRAVEKQFDIVVIDNQNFAKVK